MGTKEVITVLCRGCGCKIMRYPGSKIKFCKNCKSEIAKKRRFKESHKNHAIKISQAKKEHEKLLSGLKQYFATRTN